MARPKKIDDYVAHRIADLIIYGHDLPWSQLKKKGDAFEILVAENRVLVTGPKDVHGGIGELLCKLKPEQRPRVLRLLASVLSKKRRKAPDDIAKIRTAWREAQAELKGLYRGDNPTWREVDNKYYRRTGYHLDRRALREVTDCPVRPDKRGVKKIATAPLTGTVAKGQERCHAE